MEVAEENISVEKRLYDAAKMGDLPTIKTFVQQDRFLVEQVLFAGSRNVLHVATMEGREEIVEELLAASPELARDVDDKMSSALHIAAARGHAVIARRLLNAAPEMRWRVDDQGMNPVHVAAAQGHVPVLEVLLNDDSSPGREILDRQHTVLTLSMKHNRVAAFRFLTVKFPDLASLKDADGETVYSLALKYDRPEIVEHLSSISMPDGSIFQDVTTLTMLIVGLIATMACQNAVNPPGGVWQDSTASHKAGKSVAASSYAELYGYFSIANTSAFALSMLAILLVSTRMPNRSIFMSAAIWILTWVSILCIAVSYGIAMLITSPDEKNYTVGTVAAISILAYLAALGMVPRVWNRRKEARNDEKMKNVTLRPRSGSRLCLRCSLF